MDKVITASTRKVRDSNLELYRIIVMLLIVAHHYVVNSGLLDVMPQSSTELLPPPSRFLSIGLECGVRPASTALCLLQVILCVHHQ